jgi:hypothetical protein
VARVTLQPPHLDVLRPHGDAAALEEVAARAFAGWAHQVDLVQ